MTEEEVKILEAKYRNRTITLEEERQLRKAWSSRGGKAKNPRKGFGSKPYVRKSNDQS